MSAGFQQNARFETLWTDSPEANAQLAAMATAGRCSKSELDDLGHFIEHGWLIWRNAIPEPLIDRLVDDIRRIHEHPGMFVRTDHRRGSNAHKLTGSTPDAFESLFDLYVNLESSRLVCMHPRILRFLTLVFRSRPIAMQQLLFQRSNGHLPHQDTAFVAVQQPMLLIATWIALQDVVEGSGELAFYDRSHRLPYYLFANGSKHFNPQHDNMQAYVGDLEAACDERKLEYQRFMARKGDVFIWAADLVHRSHPRRLPEDTSRLSCVTHYCPATTQPVWFMHHPNLRGLEPLEDGTGGFYSGHYELPTQGRMIRPVIG